MADLNLNDSVKVKLTLAGIAELEEQHKELRKVAPSIGEFKIPKVDSDGYSEFQLWDLMSRLGQNLYLGGDLPFNPNIKLKDSL